MESGITYGLYVVCKGKEWPEKANVVAMLTNFIAAFGKEKASLSSDWFIGSGESCHMTSYADLLRDVYESSEIFTFANSVKKKVQLKRKADLKLSSSMILNLMKF